MSHTDQKYEGDNNNDADIEAQIVSSDSDTEVETKNSVQAALNAAREHRDNTLIKKQRARENKKVFYDPKNNRNNNNNNLDTRSIVSAVTTTGEYRDANGQAMQVVAIPAGTKLKNLVDENSSEDYVFPKLNYEDIQVNLRILADLAPDEKICISGNNRTIEIDKRYVQAVRRWYTGDSRNRTLEFIKHVYSETEALCEDIMKKVRAKQDSKENTEKLINLYSLIGSSGKGLERLNITYQDDKTNSARISTIKKNYETYCDRTLKGTIDGFKKNLE